MPHSDSNEKADITLPGREITKLYYSAVFPAAWELTKHVSRIVGAEWHFDKKWPKHYLTGMQSLSYPDVGAQDDRDPFGPGLYCTAVTDDISAFLQPLINRINNKSGYVNNFVLLLELINSDIFGNKDKVKTLCSDWEPFGETKSRVVSTNGTVYVFHCSVTDPIGMIDKVNAMVDQVSNFKDLQVQVDLIQTELKSLKDKVKEKSKIDKELSELDKSIKENVSEMSYGMPWSIRDPSLIEQFFQKYKKFVQRNDSTLNYERLSIVEKGIKSCVDLRFESDKLKEEMVHIAETINLNFSSILSVSEKFSGYQVIQKLGYCRSQVSALLLYAKGLGNRIRVEEQACFKVKAVFEFEKNVDSRLSFTKFEELQKVSEFSQIRGNFYDGFQFVRREN